MMYLVTEEMPKDCFECKFKNGCQVWDDFMKLPLDHATIIMDDLQWLKPTVFKCCKIQPLNKIASRFYLKWILKKCRHICYFCRHKEKCEIYQDGRE